MVSLPQAITGPLTSVSTHDSSSFSGEENRGAGRGVSGDPVGKERPGGPGGQGGGVRAGGGELGWGGHGGGGRGVAPTPRQNLLHFAFHIWTLEKGGEKIITQKNQTHAFMKHQSQASVRS